MDPPKPCRFFLQGDCRRGAACKFSHDPALASTVKPENPFHLDNSIDPETLSDTWVRDFGDAWVQFGDGAAITDITFPTDFSAVRVGNLPGSSTLHSVMDLLMSVGIAVSQGDIHLNRPPLGKTNGYVVATIKKKDPGFSKVACRKLRTIVIPPNLEVSSVPVTNSRGNIFRQVDNRQVRCWWFKPSRTASLVFASRPLALRVANKFRCGLYKIGAAKVMASNQPVVTTKHGQPISWTITLSGLALTVEEADITRAINLAADRPTSIVMGEPNYVADAEVDGILIRSMLEAFGPLERWDVSGGKGKRVNVHATFVDGQNVHNAVAGLHEEALPFCRTEKLFVEAVTVVRFKVSTRVFKAVEGRINREKADWARRNVNYFAFPNPRGSYRVLKLEGSNPKAVADVRKCMEGIVGGDVVMWEGKVLWYNDLKIDKDTLRKLRDIETTHNVVITREVRASRFRVYGDQRNNGQAARALHRLIEETQASRTILLHDAGDLPWAVGGGVAVLEAELGRRKIKFDIPSRSITVHGTDEDLAMAKQILARRQTEPLHLRSKLSHHQGTDTCPVCFCEAEEPVRTSCGHTYCGPCFVNLCEAETTKTTGDFCIRCVGGQDGQCRRVLPLAEIQGVLLAETFEGLLEASMASYVQRRPREFRYCPTADCTQVYRVTSDAVMAVPTVFTCSQCLASTCTACHTDHAGQTCAEYKGDASGGLATHLKMKEDLGIQDCPNCKAPVEKRDGCNHMHCRCGVHFCWKCLAIANDDKEIYIHMRALHGADIYH